MGQLFSSESVTEGHPDKFADFVSDSVLDAALEQDAEARGACEVLVKTRLAVFAGEITTKARLNYEEILRAAAAHVGYHADCGFDAAHCQLVLAIDAQSEDIAAGVNLGEGIDHGQGAGDQGLMFGFACDETPELMPLPIALAHRLTRRLADVRKDKTLPWLRADGKSQVTVEYDERGQVERLATVVLSTQHAADIGHAQLEGAVRTEVLDAVLPAHLVDDRTRILVNPTGRFVIGGPEGDAGLTGRKIIVDTYGGMARHGGGAFSGKDASKVDRSAAYFARYVARQIVAAGLARRCEVQLAYAIGVAEPVGVYVTTFGTGLLDDTTLGNLVREHFDFKPRAIIETLGLKRPIFRPTAAYGHFGRTDVALPWEGSADVEALRERAQAQVARRASDSMVQARAAS